jgi:hypothetical protein
VTANIVILQLAILTVVLESDLGRRKIGWFRVGRPIIAVAVIVPFFFTTLPTGGDDLALQAIGATVGVLAGAVSVSPLMMQVSYERAWRRRHFTTSRTPAKPSAVSHAGAGYAAIWIGATVARLGFAYGSEHWFPAQLGRFMTAHDISRDGLANAFIFLAIAMDLARSLGLFARARTALSRRARIPTTYTTA